MIHRVLFLTESREDYLADSILHGLVSLGLEVVDYPKKHILYKEGHDCSSTPKLGVRGNGFTLYGLLANRHADRSFITQRLQNGWFDLVVVGQIWRQWGQLLDLAPLLQNVPVALLDGDDDARLFHRSGTRVRRYGWQPFPIRSSRCLYLKREWDGQAGWGHRCRVLPTSFSIPEEKIKPINFENKHQLFANHCVDPEVAAAFGLQTSYAFSSEEAYYNDLAASRYAVTTKRGGWDCLRHYEIAAAGSLPCFRHLQSKPFSFAPHRLQAGVNCVSYESCSDLTKQLESLEANPLEYQRLVQASSEWVRSCTTKKAAQRLLDAAASL